MLLAGLKILDFTYLLPGPLATMTLADLGADVLKVESPTKVDLVRYVPPFIDSEGSISCVHAHLNRGKRSLALDLKHPLSLDIITRLVHDQGYDIIVEQFRPGVMARLGLSYESLARIKPDIIYCSLTGYGQTGPLKNRAGHDINYLSLAGIMGYSGTKDKGPALMGVPVADIAGAHNTVTGILAAVIQRLRTGTGQHVDVAMTDSIFAYHALAGTRVLAGDAEPDYETDVLAGGSLYGFYATADGKYLSFGGLEEQFSSAFFEALGLPDLIPGGVMQFPGIEEARARIQAVILSQPLAFWVEKFKDRDACAEPVLSFSEAAESEHARQRGLTVDVPGPDGKTVSQIACPIKFSKDKARYPWAGCALGRDSLQVVRSLAYSDEQIATMLTEGVIVDADQKVS